MSSPANYAIYNTDTAFGSGPPADVGQALGSATKFDFPVKQTTLPDELAKPYFIKTVTWTSASTINTPLDKTLLPNGSFTVNPNTMICNNYSYFRGAIRIFLKFSGTPFHQGKIMVGFIPLDKGTDTYNSTTSRLTSTTMSSKNHVVIDASMAGVYTLDIPYEHILERFSIDATTNVKGPAYGWRGLGTLVFMPVVALSYATGSTTSLPITVFAQYLDAHVSLMRPSAAPNATTGIWQSGLVPAAMSIMSDKRVQTATKGIVSSIVDKFSNRDNPIVQESTERTVRFDFAKTSGKSNAKTLGPLKDFVQPTSEQLGLSEERVTDLMQILKKPTWYNSVSWLSANPVATILYETYIYPQSFYNSTTSGAANALTHYYTPLGYFAPLFQYWRGSINITIDVASTNFHRGKLLACLYPYNQSPPSTISTATNYPHYILDIQESKTFTFSIPYDELQPYRRNWADPNAACCFKLSILVLNTLTTTVAMSSSVDVIMYVSAGDDFEFAIQDNGNPVWVRDSQVRFNGYIATVPGLRISDKPVAIAHSGVIVDESDITTIDSTPPDNVMTIVDNPPPTGPFSTLEMQFSNIVKKPYMQFSTTGFSIAQSSNYFTLFYFPVTPTPMNGIRTALLPQYNILAPCNSLLNSLGNCFRFWRGSMKYKMVFTTSKMDRVYAYVFWSPLPPVGFGSDETLSYTNMFEPWAYSEAVTPLTVTPKKAARFLGNYNLAFQDLNTNPVIDFTVPWYSPTNRLLTTSCLPPSYGPAHSDTTSNSFDYNNGFITCMISADGGEVVTTTDEINISTDVWASGGDDFEFSHYMGIPTCTVIVDPDAGAFFWQTRQKYETL